MRAKISLKQIKKAVAENEAVGAPSVPPIQSKEAKVKKEKIVRPLTSYQKHMSEYCAKHKGEKKYTELYRDGAAAWADLKMAAKTEPK